MNVTYNNFAKFLIDNFPEFNNYDKENVDLPHVIVGNFAALLIERIENDPNDKFVRKAIDLINDIFSQVDEVKLLDLIQIELFENLAQSEKVIFFSRENLNKQAREAFERAMDGFGVESMRMGR